MTHPAASGRVAAFGDPHALSGIFLAMCSRFDAVALVVEAYFDESYESGTASGRLLCVAGYVFLKSKARTFETKWAALLRRYGLPYFRMSSCAHGASPFDRLDKNDRVKAEKEAIALIRESAAYGLAVTVDEAEFDSLAVANERIATAYEFCVWICLLATRIWVEKHRPLAQIAYFFESGHADQPRANMVMKRIFDHPTLRETYRYSGHAFVPKETSLPTQAAEMLAWHWFQDSKRRREGKKPNPRKDTFALITEKDLGSLHLDALLIVEIMLELSKSELYGSPSAMSRIEA